MVRSSRSGDVNDPLRQASVYDEYPRDAMRRRQLAFDLPCTLGAQEVSPILGLLHYRLEEVRMDMPGLHPLLMTTSSRTVLLESLTDVRQDTSNGWLGLSREVLIAQYQQAERPVAGHLESGTGIRLPPLAEHLRVDIRPRRFTGVDLKTSQVRTQRVDGVPNDVEKSGPGKAARRSGTDRRCCGVFSTRRLAPRASAAAVKYRLMTRWSPAASDSANHTTRFWRVPENPAVNELPPPSELCDVVDELVVLSLIRHEPDERIIRPVGRIDVGEQFDGVALTQFDSRTRFER